ncbi:MAG: PepSY domain-containing protein [Clostridiales bacterium]|nr:PepSY domain-containing protein [Clostridiales bacterium]MCD7828372.1 PepSY domain-containing protein [Clostridiales bacterium]
MKKTIVKVLSIVLTLAMLMSFSIVAFAAISLDDAKSIALTDAGFEEAQVVITECKLDDGREYEIEFYANGAEYDYTISTSGTITSFSCDYNLIVTGDKTLDAAAAKAIALEFIGVSESDVKALYAEYENDRYEGPEYTVNFTYNSAEYEVTVSAVDGTILEYDYEVISGSSAYVSFFTIIQAIIAFFRNLFVR